MRRAVGVLALVLLLGALGGSGWAVWQLYRHDLQASRQLHESQRTLAQQQDHLKLLEQERRALADDFDALKARWVSADAKTQQLSDQSGRLTQQLTALEGTRATLRKELEETTAGRAKLQAQVQTLQDAIAQGTAERSVLEARLVELERRGLSRAELEELAQRWTAQQAVMRDVVQRLETLSRGSPTAAVSAAAPSQPATTQPVSTPADARRAARLRRVGDAYFADHHYPKAADAYEQSLQCKDDPTTRAKLAFLYDRLLNDQAKAQPHAEAAAASHLNPALVALSNSPAGTKVPRAHWRLVWDWLTQ